MSFYRHTFPYERGILQSELSLISDAWIGELLYFMSSGIGGHINVMLGVRDITNASAVLDWVIPDDKPIAEFKVSSHKQLSKQ